MGACSAPSPRRTSSTPSRRPAASASTAARSTSTSRSARSARAWSSSRSPTTSPRPSRRWSSKRSRSATSAKKDVVERYVAGLRAGDHDAILDCLTDDVGWEMPPHYKLSGKPAFEGAIWNEAAPGRPDIEIVRLVEEDDVVVA